MVAIFLFKKGLLVSSGYAENEIPRVGCLLAEMNIPEGKFRAI